MERESIPYQELKIEFILQPEKWEYERRTGENIFAVNSSWNYQILPLNYLFADKLTTLGCNTIGVQNERLDEQVFKTGRTRMEYKEDYTGEHAGGKRL